MTPNSSLLQWLATFHLAGQPAVELKNDAYYNLADGYVSARILNQISPHYFTDKWLDGIKPVPPNGSWRLRVSNLKRILQKIHDYASDLQSSQFRLSAINPDVTVIAQNFDPDQICRLIQLILFCAINCDKKQDYIEKIRDLPTQVKQDIKEAIEELLVRNNDSQQNSNTSHVGNESARSDSDPKNSSHKFNLSSTSQNVLASPANVSGQRNFFRRDSSQNSDQNKKNESHLDISTQSYYSDASETVEEIRQKLFHALAIKDEKSQACHELEMKLKQLQLERDQLAHDNEKLTSEISSSTPIRESSRRHSSSAKDLKLTQTNLTSDVQSKDTSEVVSQDLILLQNRRMQSEIHRLKEELIRTETEKEDFRLKSNLLKEDLDRITTRHEELRIKAERAKRLQDELDEHKHITEKVMSYETMVENLVKKNNDMKKELKSLEEKNLTHVQTIVGLEQENQQLVDQVNQIEIYRRQLNDAQVKLSEETHRADQAEVELSRLSDKFDATKRENEKLFEATNQLMRNSSVKDKLNELSEANKVFESVNLKDSPSSSQKNPVAPFDSRTQHGGDNMLESLTTPVIDLKERIARLEMENQILEAKLKVKAESSKSVLGGLLNEATNKSKKLEGENRQMRKRLMALESTLKEMAQAGGAQPSTSGGNIAFAQDFSSDNDQTLVKRNEELQQAVFQKEHELHEAEVRYKKNLEKAKEVIKALNNNQSIGGSLHLSCMSSTSFNSNSLDELNILRQQLRDREDRLISLEREFFEFRKLKEVHERLILSAFHGLTTQMQWKNAERRLDRTTLTSPPNTASSSINNHPGKHSH